MCCICEQLSIIPCLFCLLICYTESRNEAFFVFASFAGLMLLSYLQRSALKNQMPTSLKLL